MNQKKYDSLPADLKQVIDNLSGAWGAEFAGAAWDKGEEDGITFIIRFPLPTGRSSCD